MLTMREQQISKMAAKIQSEWEKQLEMFAEQGLSAVQTNLNV